jgi:hypothetical protein
VGGNVDLALRYAGERPLLLLDPDELRARPELGEPRAQVAPAVKAGAA